ncbi:MAG: hypothetical protein ACLGI6_20375 [Gammaproteobacteria bacterium]
MSAPSTSGPRYPGLDTLCLHAGTPADASASVLEQRLAALHGGVAAIASATLLAALELLLATVARAGDAA